MRLSKSWDGRRSAACHKRGKGLKRDIDRIAVGPDRDAHLVRSAVRPESRHLERDAQLATIRHARPLECDLSLLGADLRNARGLGRQANRHGGEQAFDRRWNRTVAVA